MPIGLLTAAERDRLNHFPTQIPDEDLRTFFLLSDADHTAINKQREDHTRLGFALRLCARRYLGFVPHHLHADLYPTSGRATEAVIHPTPPSRGSIPDEWQSYRGSHPSHATVLHGVHE